MPTQDLKVAMLPIDIVYADAKANICHVTQRIKELDADTDMVILPEMFSTGFICDTNILSDIAETNDGNTISALQTLARELNIGICGSFIATDNNNRYFNRSFVIGDNAEITFYDKRHLFSCGDESRLFTPGSAQSPIISFRTWKLRMAICYDIRFPVWNRSIANNYDALLVPANWPHVRFYAWKHMLIARAIENQVYALGCNREGRDVYGAYERGDSLAFDESGKNVSERRDDGTIYCIMNAWQLNRNRHKFTPWRDADKFNIDF